MAQIRKYLFSLKDNDVKVVIEAYDLNEALVQWHIKYGDSVTISEVIPFSDYKEPQHENKKELKVKPNPFR